jgi:signal transduction histidine kinase
MMRRSIFLRVASILIAVLLVGISITGAVFYVFLENKVVDDKAVLLKQSGKRIVESLGIYLNNQESALAPILFRSFIDSIGGNAASMIWISKDDGTLVMASDVPAYMSGRMEDLGDGRYRLLNPQQYTLASGSDGDYLKGDFYGLFKGSGIEWLTVRIPFSFEKMPPYGLDLNGVVLMHAKMPEIQSARNTTIRLFALSSGAGILVSLLLGFFFSRQLSSPLKQMSQAARRIASGQFSERLAIRSQDEFGQLAKSFNGMVDALSRLEEIRRDFVSNVSHELRTPLTSIKGFVEGILDGTIPEDRQQNYLRIVRDEANRMNRMVSDLLDLTKMEAGGANLVPIVFDVCELVRICVISQQQALIDKNLEFEAEFQHERMFIRADRDAVQRVLLNLMQNAIKFTPDAGTIRGAIRTVRDKTEISISDTGIGISADELPFVFDRFYKTDKSRSSDRSGVGIGLAIVRSIMLAHHEEIRVVSTPNEGTTFTFTMPTEPDPQPELGYSVFDS